MHKNEVSATMRSHETSKRRPVEPADAPARPKTSRRTAARTRSAPKGAEDLAKIVHAQGRPGAERLRAKKIDLSAPLARSPRSEYGGLVSRLMRRRAEGAGLSVGALLAATGGSGAHSVSSPLANGSQAQSGALPGSFDPLLVLLVKRVTGGFNRAEYVLAESLGFDAYLTHHLNPGAIPDTDVDDFLAGDPTPYYAAVANDSAHELLTGGIQDAILTESLQGQILYREVLTKRGLLYRMQEFWRDHFNIDVRLTLQSYAKPVDEREVLLANALGWFPDMLEASAHSPSMLLYLDQASSAYQAPNENYARELMELHTLGEGQGYTEEDVVEVAQVLAGWTVSSTAPFLEFLYDSNLHDPAAPAFTLLRDHPRKINIPAAVLGGENQGDALIAGLGRHPLTAKAVARKMLRFLLRYEPTEDQVDDVKSAYLTKIAMPPNPPRVGNIKKMIRRILTPNNLNPLLASSPPTLKVKRPMQLAATFLRALESGPQWGIGLEPNPLRDLFVRLRNLGHAPLLHGPPDGYPDSEGAWIGNLIGRWDLLDAIVRNELDGIDVTFAKLVNLLLPLPADDLFGCKMNEVLAGGTMSVDEEFWIQQYFEIGSILVELGHLSLEDLTRELFAVAASAPSYQYY